MRLLLYSCFDSVDTGDLEIKRAAGYFLATICEQVEFHRDALSEGSSVAEYAMI
jgi:hypothetical protein